MIQPKLEQLKSFGQDLLDFIFPNHCYICSLHLESSRRFVCQNCLESMPVLAEPICPVCKKFRSSLRPEHTCRTNLQSVYSVWTYSELAGILIHKFKYEGKTALGVMLAKKLAAELKKNDFLSAMDVIIPVPLYPARKRERGFNQAEIIAKELAETYGLALWTETLRRAKNTRDQTLLSAQQRQENVRNAFRTSDGTELLGQNVLLVDDVVTTGATLNECARTLGEAGVKQVWACTLAVVA